MSEKTRAKEEAEWQASGDAYTLAQAEVIRKDSKRMKAAQGAAKKQATEKEEEAESMRAVASGQLSYPTMKEEKEE